MANQSDYAAALQKAGVNVYGLQVSGAQVSGTVGSGEDRLKAVSAIQSVQMDAQVNIQVNEGFADKGSGNATAGRTYTVKAGDTLSKIAKEVYGDAGSWKKIHEANRAAIPNPDLIHPGQELQLP
ncbi:LysM peptidoglycan-binding domain-containing protein [Roseisolibacter sp. H3M3-2]|uniref:LysM peptidoglycan-binding domain-containing protein n=1 Tax=Roseisolibacter sp. H3M3-2 TaxID=3031323 RepID=UPI0023DADAFB|nr:LysM peptidoglycan-binding domain-containing protein [Roseisolibacter sp. H3M3-2]MDF1503961.1 LysM peptidoglycan-binding domain-containing protein [Roseisolibacter sp. H3M3-2]